MRLLLAVLVMALALPALALAWPTSSYRGHGTNYYNLNGVNYAMVFFHAHKESGCSSGHVHHYGGYKQAPGGYYIRLGDHDHHLCAAGH